MTKARVIVSVLLVLRDIVMVRVILPPPRVSKPALLTRDGCLCHLSPVLCVNAARPAHISPTTQARERPNVISISLVGHIIPLITLIEWLVALIFPTLEISLSIVTPCVLYVLSLCSYPPGNGNRVRRLVLGNSSKAIR